MSDSLFDPPTDRMKDRATSGAIITGIAQAAKMGTQMLSVVTLSRLLKPEDFGLLAITAPLLAFLGMLQDLGLVQAAIQRKVLTHNQASWLFWVNAGVGCTLAVVLLLCGPVIGSFYHDPRITNLVMASAIFLAIYGLGSQHGALLNRQMRFRALAAIDSITFFIGFVVALLVAYFTRSYWALFLGTATTATLYLASLFVATKWMPTWPKREDTLRSLLTYGIGLTGFNMANFVSRNLDNVLIGKRWGSEQLGLYDRAYKLLLFPLQQINFPLQRVMLPALSQLVDNEKRYRSAYLRVARLVILITQPGVIFLIVTDDWLIPTLLGQKWAHAAPIFSWLGIAALVQPFNNTIGWLMLSQGRTTELARWGIVSAVISAIAFVIGLPWGPVGVAMAYGLGDTVVRSVPLWMYAGRKGPVSFNHLWRTAILFVPSAIAAALTLYLFKRFVPIEPIPGLVICAGLSYAVFGAVLLLFPTGREIIASGFDLLNSVRFWRRRAAKPTPTDA